MKTVIEAREAELGIEPRHEIEVLCANCQDPVSELEEVSGACSNCSQPWQEVQHVSIWITTVPAAGGKTWGSQ
jgi:Zn finger protein HypA/HybF involved in hydrogenase expression